MFNFANRTSTANQSYASNKSNRSNRSKLTRSNGTSEYDHEKKRNKDRKRDSEESKARFLRFWSQAICILAPVASVKMTKNEFCKKMPFK